MQVMLVGGGGELQARCTKLKSEGSKSEEIKVNANPGYSWVEMKNKVYRLNTSS
ncbi:conserved hypothetical protein [Ricinus communis]|uniref:Uncharacterized protein n=1 Tax=Ricinus communis TaxID=3988 RepID=B9SGU5_RICCO|nr:conserved hypothetical protein [Ricinus communis]